VKGEKVNSNGNEHANVKGDPKPDARCHGGQRFMPRGVEQSQIARSTDATYTSQVTNLFS
jgi:hypothetical protein